MSQRPSKGMSKNNGQHAPSNNLDSTGNNGSKYDRHTANTLRDVPRGFSLSHTHVKARELRLSGKHPLKENTQRLF